MPTGTPIEDEEIAEILTQYHLERKKGRLNKEACTNIGVKVGRRWEVIAHLVARYASTGMLAKAIIEKGSAQLARRIIQEADVSESIDVLERIKVLEPKAGKGASEGGPTLMLSVSAESCGAVMIGVNQYGTQGQQASREGVPSGDHVLAISDEDPWIGPAGLPALRPQDALLLGLQGRDEGAEEAGVLITEGDILDVPPVPKTRDEVIAAGRAKIAAARLLKAQS